MQSLGGILCLLLLINSISSSTVASDEDEKSLKLPFIWSEKSIGHNTSERSYRFAGDIQLADSDKWYLFEEWGSMTRKKFRFDLIESPTGKRRTLLAYEQSDEKFVYQPFTCSMVENLNDELYESLKNKFPPSQEDQLLSTGIGSIWTHAERLEQTYVGPSCDDCKIDRTALRSSMNLENLKRYTVEPTSNYPYRVEFYFRSDKLQDEPKTLVLIRMLDSSGKVMMVVKMFGYEPIPQASPDGSRDESDIYDLPLGYGCKRRIIFEESFAVPIDLLKNRVHPQILRLDIVSLQPQNVEDDMEKWKTHSMSVKMVYGRLSLELENRDYLMLETQEYAPEQEQIECNAANFCPMDGGKTNRATLRRLRRVWDLGVDGLTGGERQNRMAVYFEIDERRARCLSMGEVEVKDAADIQFPIGAVSNKTNDSNQYKVPGLILSNELLEAMFGFSYDFHMIREFSQGRRKEFIYERRQSDFKLHDKRGKELWSGPVSLIKRQSMYVNDFGRKAKTQRTLDVSSRVTIQFLSKDLEKLVSKITIALADKQPISGAALHRELNIATLCYNPESWPETSNHQRAVPADLGAAIGRWNYKRREKKSTNLEISLTYPIKCDASSADDESTTRPPSSLISNSNSASSCDALKRFLASPRLAEPVIYEQFLSSLFRTMRGRLDPIQLSQVGVLMSPQLEAVRVSAKLVARPSLLAFSEIPRQRFARARRSHIHTELKPSRIACADSCQHLNCTSFVYCPMSNECNLSLDDEDNIYDGDRKHLLYEPDATCSVFKVARGRQTDIMSPQEVVQELRWLVETRPALLELKLRELDDQGRWVNSFQLRPQRFESDSLLLAQNDLFNEAELTGDDNDVETNIVEEEEENKENRVEIEYEVVALNRNFKPTNERVHFKSDFPIGLAKRMSYEDCESLCNELDCQSFSHCQLEQTCQVSQLRGGTKVLEASEPEDFCHIFGRDYLSKFTRNLKLESGLLLVDLSKSLNVSSAHDCALHCMEESDFKCRSFYACSEMAPDHTSSSIDCHLRRSHLSGAASEIRSDSELLEHSAALQNDVVCHLYTRSYLVEFDKFYGRALADDSRIAPRSMLFRNLGAEGCGLECAERRGLCWAFQVCRPKDKTGLARQGPICALSLVAEPTNQSVDLSPSGAQSWSKVGASDWLVANERCTTFVVSAGSELASLPVRNELARAHFDAKPPTSKATVWGRAMLVLVAGLALGLAAGWGRQRWRISRSSAT